jgi:hypothetical protein
MIKAAQIPDRRATVATPSDTPLRHCVSAPKFYRERSALGKLAGTLALHMSQPTFLRH